LPYFAAHSVAGDSLTQTRKHIETTVPTTPCERGFFVRAEDAFGAAVVFEEAR